MSKLYIGNKEVTPAIQVSSTEPVTDALNVTPTTSAQTFTAPTGVAGYDTVNVSAVTSAIDSNITAGNIKNGVSILGVSGNVVELVGETRTVTLNNKDGVTYTPSSGKNGITSIKVTPNNQGRTITPSTSSQSIAVGSGYSGNGDIFVNPVTSAIDSNITAGNIKNGVSILGVRGTYIGGASTRYDCTLDTFVPEVNAEGVMIGRPDFPITNPVFTGVKDIGTSALEYRFYYFPNVQSVSFPDLENVTGQYAFNNTFRHCEDLTSISFPKLKTVNATSAMVNAFYQCQNTNFTTVSFPELTTVNTGMSSCFYQCTYLTTVSFPKLETLGGTSLNAAFQGCTRITSVDLHNLQTVNGAQALQNTFNGCNQLPSIDLSGLTVVASNLAMNATFSGCTVLSSIDFTNLQRIGNNVNNGNNNEFQQAFYNCNALLELRFPSLTEIYCTGSAATGTFNNNNKLQELYFPSLTTITYGANATTANQKSCQYIFSNCAALTEIHFASANRAAIEATAGYATQWGATNATVYFDL